MGQELTLQQYMICFSTSMKRLCWLISLSCRYHPKVPFKSFNDCASMTAEEKVILPRWGQENRFLNQNHQYNYCHHYYYHIVAMISITAIVMINIDLQLANKASFISSFPNTLSRFPSKLFGSMLENIVLFYQNW